MSFQPLAEDISKNPNLANLLHGFIIKAQKLLSDKKGSKIQKSFSTHFSTTTTEMMNINQDSISNNKMQYKFKHVKYYQHPMLTQQMKQPWIKLSDLLR
mmetsp:Transcript_25280/g.50440  ORF Transcript_25280/g.50440 Transcript_25280/m.50440 type:complete len:99 (+) Transcript_25280:49-345(+)